MDSNFQPRPILFQNPGVVYNSLLSSFNLDGKARTLHELSLLSCVISLCSLTPQPCNERLIFAHYWRLIQGIMISNSFAKAEIWCEISILIIFRIIFQLNYFTYWSKRSHYCFSCGTKHLVQSSWIPAAVSLGQNFTPGYLLSLNPLLSWSCSLWLPSSYFFFFTLIFLGLMLKKHYCQIKEHYNQSGFTSFVCALYTDVQQE